jgi:hypothetical protein
MHRQPLFHRLRSAMSATPAQLRKAALAIAKGRYPSQTGDVHPNAFARKADSFCEIRMSGGSVLVGRDEAESLVAEWQRSE